MKPNYEQEVLKLKDSPYVSQQTVEEFLKFIHSGNPLVKPQNSAHHLCSFFLPIHEESKSVYLGHHIKAGSWIPPGGHIEPGESPSDAAKREFSEELGMQLKNEVVNLFNLSVVHIDDPRLCKTHYDFWYAIFADKFNFQYDKREFYEAGWFPIHEAVNKVTNPVYKPVFLRIQSSWEMLTQ